MDVNIVSVIDEAYQLQANVCRENEFNKQIFF